MQISFYKYPIHLEMCAHGFATYTTQYTPKFNHKWSRRCALFCASTSSINETSLFLWFTDSSPCHTETPQRRFSLMPPLFIHTELSSRPKWSVMMAFTWWWHLCVFYRCISQVPPLNLNIYLLTVYNHIDAVIKCCDWDPDTPNILESDKHVFCSKIHNNIITISKQKAV